MALGSCQLDSIANEAIGAHAWLVEPVCRCGECPGRPPACGLACNRPPHRRGEVRMLRHTPWVSWFLGAASLGLLAFTGLRFASSRTGAGLRPGRPASPIGTATATTTGEQIAATVSPNPDRSGSIDRRPASGEGTTPGAPADLTLAKEQREYLWQVEHHGLILSRRGFSRIAKVLKDNDAGALLALFADGFEGEVPGQPREVRFERD